MSAPGPRKAAKIAGLIHYFTGQPCKNGHVANRLASNGSCVVCTQERDKSSQSRAVQAAWRARNADAIKAYQAAYAEEHREKKATYDKRYRADNREKRIAYDRVYYRANHAACLAAARAWYRANRALALAYHRKRQIAKAPQLAAYKTLWWSRNKDRLCAYNRHRYFANRAEALARMARWREKNKDRLRETNRAYYLANLEAYAAHAHTRRARKLGNGGRYTAADIIAIFAAQEGRCAYCGADIRGRYHIDHWLPLCLGGSNGPENLQLTCGRCNLRKGRKHPDVFEREIGYVRRCADAIRSCSVPR